MVAKLRGLLAKPTLSSIVAQASENDLRASILAGRGKNTHRRTNEKELVNSKVRNTYEALDQHSDWIYADRKLNAVVAFTGQGQVSTSFIYFA